MLVSSLKLSGGHNVCPVWSCSSIKPSKCPRGTGIGAHDEPESLPTMVPESLPTMVPESVPTMLRNECPRCAGIRKLLIFIFSMVEHELDRRICSYELLETMIQTSNCDLRGECTEVVRWRLSL